MLNDDFGSPNSLIMCEPRLPVPGIHEKNKISTHKTQEMLQLQNLDCFPKAYDDYRVKTNSGAIGTAFRKLLYKNCI